MIVDLRSDTVTRPTEEMLQAMVSAPLGDDVLGDEPTVQKLEAMSAEILGKEAAMFVPSGTMGNQIAIKTWTQPGEAILVNQDAHVVLNESGGPGALSGVNSWTIDGEHGIMSLAKIESRISAGNLHTPRSSLLCLENTHNRGGGTVVPTEMMSQYWELAKRNEMKVHLDGARIFNAAVALGVPAIKICQYADSVNFCLSKGLSCPVGSVLTGPADFINQARHHRKRMGGSMRQAGVLAACGIVALNSMIDRLAEDHVRARKFAESIDNPDLEVDLETVQTNIVRVSTKSPASGWVEKLRSEGVLTLAASPQQLRFVFHREIDDAKVDKAISCLRVGAINKA